MFDWSQYSFPSRVFASGIGCVRNAIDTGCSIDKRRVVSRKGMLVKTVSLTITWSGQTRAKLKSGDAQRDSKGDAQSEREENDLTRTEAEFYLVICHFFLSIRIADASRLSW